MKAGNECPDPVNTTDFYQICDFKILKNYFLWSENLYPKQSTFSKANPWTFQLQTNLSWSEVPSAYKEPRCINVERTGASCPGPAGRRLWWEVSNRFLWGLRGSVNTYRRLVSRAPPDLSSLLEPLERYRAISYFTRNATLRVAWIYTRWRNAIQSQSLSPPTATVLFLIASPLPLRCLTCSSSKVFNRKLFKQASFQYV